MVNGLPEEGQARLLPALFTPVQRRNDQGASSRETFDTSLFNEEDVVEVQIDAEQQRAEETQDGNAREAVLLRPRFQGRGGENDAQLGRPGQDDLPLEAGSGGPREEEVVDTYRRNAVAVFAPFPLGGNLDLVG